MASVMHPVLTAWMVALVFLGGCHCSRAERGLLSDQQYASAPTPRPAKVQQQAMMESQYRALLAVKAAVAGKYGDRDLPSWKPSKTAAAGGYCRWKGVKCNRHNLVVDIGLQEMGLGGVLPPASVLRPLTALRGLWLGRNGIGGTLPGSWSTLTKLLELDLSGLDLTGTLPPSWGDLKHLQRLWLHAEGPGDLSGTLPSSWSGMSHLIQLTLGGHDINGTLPPAWGALKQLETLHLSGTELSGTLPDAWAGMSSITGISLSYNALTGTLPPAWGALSKLQSLFLEGRSPGDGDKRLSGPLPSAWSGMSSITDLRLSRNALTGTLPPTWGALSKLQSLYLYGNNLNLSGTLPRAWSDSMADISVVRWSDNPLASCPDPPPSRKHPRAGPTTNSLMILC